MRRAPDPHREGELLLEQLAAEAEARAEWQGYAAYARARLRGLRAPALEHMTAFVAHSDGWPEPARRAFAEWLCVRLAPHADAPHDVTPQPLVSGLLLPTLFRWIEQEPEDARPHRWLGQLFRSVYVRGELPVNPLHHLRRAVELDPAESSARVSLVERLLDSAAHDTHLLPDRFFGEPVRTLAMLDEAAWVASGIGAPDEREALERAIAFVRRMVQDWIEFEEAGARDFVAWCEEHGRSYAWTRNYHFER